jgi:hypothetical protein
MKTIYVQNPDKPDETMLINEKDFDPAVHVLPGGEKGEENAPDGSEGEGGAEGSPEPQGEGAEAKAELEPEPHARRSRGKK